MQYATGPRVENVRAKVPNLTDVANDEAAGAALAAVGLVVVPVVAVAVVVVEAVLFMIRIPGCC
jgi:hypothetical protein